MVSWRCEASTRCDVPSGTSTCCSASSRFTTTPLPAVGPPSRAQLEREFAEQIAFH
jgi:hypothetical protein